MINQNVSGISGFHSLQLHFRMPKSALEKTTAAASSLAVVISGLGMPL